MYLYIFLNTLLHVRPGTTARTTTAGGVLRHSHAHEDTLSLGSGTRWTGVVVNETEDGEKHDGWSKGTEGVSGVSRHDAPAVCFSCRWHHRFKTSKTYQALSEYPHALTWCDAGLVCF